MKDRDIFDILSEKQLRKTKIRQELLQLFQKKIMRSLIKI